MVALIFRNFVILILVIWAGDAAAQQPAAGKEVQTQGVNHDWYREASKDVHNLLARRAFQEALRKNTALLERVRKEFGAESFDAAVVLSKEGIIYGAWSKHAEAARAFEQSLKLMETLFGPVHAQVAILQANLAQAYGSLQRKEEAKALFDKAMKIAIRASGAESDTVRQVLNLYAIFNSNHGDKATAQKQFARLIELTRKVSGPNSNDLIDAYTKMAQAMAAREAWEELDAYIRDTLAKLTAERGEQDTFTLQIMADFAKLKSQLGHLQAAEVLYRRIVELSEKHLGPEHRFTVANYLILAGLLQARSAHDEAIALYEKALTRWQKAFGDSNNRNHDVYLSYGISLRKRSRFEEAESAFRAAIKISEKVLGQQHNYNVKPQIALAGLYQELGRLRASEQLYKSALDTSMKLARGADDGDVALILDNLGVLCSNMGRPDEAEKYSKQSLEMFERLEGVNGANTIFVLSNLANVYSATGRSTEALQYTTRALTIVNEIPALRDNPVVGVLLDNLGGLFSDRGNLEGAQKYQTKAYEFFLRVYGKDSPDLAIAAQNLGNLNSKRKDYQKAEEWHRQALGIFERVYGKQNRHYAASLREIGSVRLKLGDKTEAFRLINEALQITLAILPPDHPDIIRLLTDKGEVYWLQGEFQEAYDAYRKAADIIARRQDDAHLEAIRQEALQGLIRTADKLEDAAADERYHFIVASFEAAQRLRNSKTSAALAQMSARFTSGDDALANLVRDLQDISQQLSATETKLTEALGASGNKRDDKLIGYLRRQRERLSAELTKLNDQVSQNFPAYAELSRPQPLSIVDLQKQLGRGELFIQYQVGDHDSFVWVIGPDKISWYRLGSSKAEIQKHVAALRCGLETSGWWKDAKEGRCEDILGRQRDGALLPFDLTLAHQLYKTVFGPFERDIAGKRLTIVPSGPLTAIPFEVLLTKPASEQFASDTNVYASLGWLAKSNAITMLPGASSLKALRQFARASSSAAPYTGYGDPKLTGTPDCPKIEVPDRCETPNTQPTLLAQVFGSLQSYFRGGTANTITVASLCPLPDTAHELKCVGESLGAGPETIHTGLAATETLLKGASAKGELERYRVLHFATHGLLADETQQVSKTLAEPALVLTPPVQPDREDDGLLTASEVARLKLNADWVVLSACNTAGGDQPGAEALSGLARAFFYAGARALLVSHWPVNSTAAVKLTTGAFTAMRLDPKIGRAEAMRQSITALIDNGKSWEAHPSYWAPFIVVGEGGAAR